MKVLVTGGCGFIGANVANEALKRGDNLYIFDNLARTGADANLHWLGQQGAFKFIHGDVRCFSDLAIAINEVRPDVVFHLAGQVAMSISIQNCRLDFETNVCGGFNLLDAIRLYSKDTTVVYSSTNKVYGDLEYLNYQEMDSRYVVPEWPIGFDESLPLDFRSPYGCSKGAIDQYMLDYARIFQIKTIVFRHSSVFGIRQFATFDQGWIGWFIEMALKTKSDPNHQFTVSGNGKQVRDVLFVSDLVSCYYEAINQIDLVSGNVFNIGGGFENSMSILELFEKLEYRFGVRLNFSQIPWRESDQKVFISDNTKLNKKLGWRPNIDKDAGIHKMIDWVERISNAGRN